MRPIMQLCAATLCCMLVAMGCAKEEKAPPVATQVSFEKEIMPVFLRSCGVCHRREGGNAAAIAHAVYYENSEDVWAKIGTYIIPGKPEESGLLKVLNQSFPVGESQVVMPPPAADVPKWSEAELALFTQWIEQGAKRE